MISIIVSSYKEEKYKEFEKSVEQTVGVPYEIIKINNAGLMGVCKAYNLGGEKARYKYLCFSHEDIIFKTLNWGQIVVNTFNETSNLGLLGIAGSDYKTKAPGSFFCSDIDRVFMNIIQHNERKQNLEKTFTINPTGEDLAEVVCVDGVWFCTTNDVFNEVKFDEETFKGYHCYDVDYCLSVCKKYKAVVTYKILIEHLSPGNFDKEWIEETMKLFEKWKTSLPVCVRPYPDPKPMKLEVKTLVDFIVSMYDNSFSPFKIVKYYNLVSPSIAFSFNDKLYLYYTLFKQFVKHLVNYKPASKQLKTAFLRRKIDFL